MSLKQIFGSTWLRYVVAIFLVMTSAGLRLWPLQGLELRIPYVTFYPAVIVAALYGGLPVGLLTTALSALTIIFWSPTGQPFIKDSGDWLGMDVFLVNCTMISFLAEAMLRAQARAKKAQAQAEAANRAKSVFLATMSHELRTPLNAILGFSDLMRADSGITPAQRENLDVINRSGRHLLSLIDDVLDMAKIEAGKVTLEVKPFDLGATAGDIVGMLRARAEEKGLQLLFDRPPGLPRFIYGDAEKLRQVIVNLVSNAIKYTDRGSVNLRLGATPAGEMLQLAIEVEDTGAGIAEADQAHIFEPFVQVGKLANRKGTGLGLAIVREYVVLMGGTVSVESTPGKGSLFRVELVVQNAEAAAIKPAEPQVGRVVGLAPGQPEFRILIVEDQEENWLLLWRLLEGAGFKVMVAENGEAGVEMFQRFHPDFIWMDRRMPLMDGLEATRRIRALKDGREVKIAAVTASAFADQREEMLGAGMDDFVRKPYLPAEIFECMAKHLGVRYVYDQAVPAEAEAPLSPAALGGLPDDLRRELADGLIVGDVDRLAGLMRRIEQRDGDLAKVLARYLSRFDYAPVLKVLDAAQTNVKETAP